MEKTGEAVSLLCVRSLSKSFDGARVLDGFSLSLPERSFTVLVGGSGCGKSSFFSLLMGMTTPDAGDVLWRGERVPELSRLAAMMWQRDMLLPWFTLLQNVMLPIAASGGDENSPSGLERAVALIERMGLSGCENAMPHTLSGGMRQRAALARTLMFDRELLLLDEPFSALDAITRRSLLSFLAILRGEFKKTILMITHDVEEALRIADSVVVLGRDPMHIRDVVRPGEPADKAPRAMSASLIEMRERIYTMLENS